MLTELVTPESLEVQVSVAQQAFATQAEMDVFPIQVSASSAPDSETIFYTIGGNLKGLLPAGVRLNTPKVTAEQPLDASSAGCLSCLTFASQFGACRLLLLSTD